MDVHKQHRHMRKHAYKFTLVNTIGKNSFFAETAGQQVQITVFELRRGEGGGYHVGGGQFTFISFPQYIIWLIARQVRKSQVKSSTNILRKFVDNSGRILYCDLHLPLMTLRHCMAFEPILCVCVCVTSAECRKGPTLRSRGDSAA